MIEIKITIDAALSLLLQRMKVELKVRQKSGLVAPGFRLEDLMYKDLIALVEASVFDTVFLLPVELIRTETNLVQIITDTIRALSRVLHREEFLLYKKEKTQRIISVVSSHLNKSLKESNFIYN